ncbi:FecR family protein [Rudanella lutea]|uniref:FecR family protein n=1 Tax=Rudanella lutea TaxID=451374 RepID=UPI00035E3DEC|nr:FecR family protein [Rudanella lutea]
MKPYETYSVHDFLTDDLFLTWVKHDEPEARQFWLSFMEQHPHRRSELLFAKDIAETLHRRPRPLSDAQVQREVSQIMRLADRAEATGLGQPLYRRVLRYPALLAASVLLVGLGVWSGWQWQRALHILENDPIATSSPGKGQAGWVSQTNGTSQPVSLTLPDGSRVLLQPNSQARYQKAFSQTHREVWLTGDAMFAVVYDPARPFLVRNGSLVTRVLGTRFRVHAPANGPRVTVSVLSGKVSVYDQRDLTSARRQQSRQLPGVILTANQQVVYDPERISYQKELVPKPTLIRPDVPPETFDFQDTPVSVVFERLQKNYGVTIQYDAALLRPCTLTASLAGVPLHDQLGLICASIGATYQIVDTQIVISGRGCL